MATPESDGRESEEQAITESKTEVGEQLLLFKEIFNFKKFVRDQLVPSESSDLPRRCSRARGSSARRKTGLPLCVGHGVQ